MKMKNRTLYTLLLCLSIVCLSFGFATAVSADAESGNHLEDNVITESDAGGGNITQKDLLWIILGVLVVILLVVAIS